MSNINQASIMRAATNGIALGIVEEAVGDHKGKQAVMAGLYMGAGSLATDVLGGSNPLSNPSIWGPSAKAFSDSVFFTAIEAITERRERSWEDAFRNFLYGFGSSFLVSTVSAPLMYFSPMMAAPADSPGAPPATNQPTSRYVNAGSY